MTVERMSTSTLRGGCAARAWPPGRWRMRRRDLGHLLAQQAVVGRRSRRRRSGRPARTCRWRSRTRRRRWWPRGSDAVSPARLRCMATPRKSPAKACWLAAWLPWLASADGRLGIVGVLPQQVADLDRRRGIDGRDHGIGVAVTPTHLVGHVRFSSGIGSGKLGFRAPAGWGLGQGTRSFCAYSALSPSLSRNRCHETPCVSSGRRPYTRHWSRDGGLRVAATPRPSRPRWPAPARPAPRPAAASPLVGRPPAAIPETAALTTACA